MEISIIPIGTKKTSISRYVAFCEEVLKNIKGIRAQLTAMGTIVEADSLKKLFTVAQKMHKKALSHGVKRVLTNITIDDRLDKKTSIEGKVESVRRKLHL
ncbi:MAG: MTH1187 family thiamine-binding protein [Candidatus Omnitrophica bacterium]|nr:MTH1187 family thiamine-binding protein [Candidatus Omnitrophota bacterium]